MGKGHPRMDMFQIWFETIGKVNELDKNKFSYYICNWIHDNGCYTHTLWASRWTWPFALNQTHNKIYIQSGV